MNRTLLVALSAALAAPAVPQLPGAKFPPPKNAPPVFVPKNRKDRPKAPAKPKPVWQEFTLPKTTLLLDLTEASPDAVLQLFSRQSGITILRDPNFKTPLTVTSGKAVSLNEAFEILDTVLSLNGYSLQKRGNLLLVARPPQPQPQGPSQPPPQPPQPEIKTYPVVNANAAQVARVLNDILGAAAAPAGGGDGGFNRFGGGFPQPPPPGGGAGGVGGAGKFKATSEEYSNAVVVYALPADQAKAEALIKSLDGKPATPTLDSEVFKLKYVPADQAVSAIEDVLTANSPTGRGKKAESRNPNPDFFYNPYGNGSPQGQKTAGGESATALKSTNSVIVNATPANMALVKKLIENLDVQGATVGTTFLIRLENAKASDVADLLNKLFTPQGRNNSEYAFFDYYESRNNRNKGVSDTDTDENGQIVNVREVQGKVTVVADPNTNSIVVQTQPGNMRSIRPIVEKLDQQATQVMIETVIVEANLNKTDKLGVEYGTLGSLINGSGDQGSGSIDFGLNSDTDKTGLRYTIGNPDYRIFLSAVQKDERFKVLDTPRVFTSNNAEAVINVGQRVPYITNSNVGPLGNVINSYNFLDVAVKLTVTPRITANGQVTMTVAQTADDVQGFTSYNAPIVNNRSATTVASVADGETIVLGGIIRHTTTHSVTKVPILGDLPILGQLFRSNVRQNGQTELMVFLTPHVVRTNADAQKLRSDKTNELSKSSRDDLNKIAPPKRPGG